MSKNTNNYNTFEVALLNILLINYFHLYNSVSKVTKKNHIALNCLGKTQNR